MTRTVIFTLLAVAAVAAAIYFIDHKGHVEGVREAKLAAVQDKADELREANRLQGAVRAKEAADTNASQKRSVDLLKEKRRVEAERDRALADVDAGRLRLRDAEERARAAAAGCRIVPPPGTGTGGSEPAAKEGGLPGEREKAVVRLLSEADAVVVELNACWRTVRADRGMPEPE